MVAPLNWGLGHATRCIPIINNLILQGYTPIIASDGNALQLLKKEFPTLKALELPSYEIEYPENGTDFKWKMIKNMPKMYDAITREKKLVKSWVKEFELSGIISDNRLGVRSKKIPSVFITHQLNVLTGNTTWISSKLHQLVIHKYAECWVPDFSEFPNLTGKLGHLDTVDSHIRYIGPLSRFEKKPTEIKNNLLVVLSGPEPQRTQLEKKLSSELLKFEGKILFVRGVVETEQRFRENENITFVNFMTSRDLEKAFNESEIVLCRSGYTTIMDLAKLGKKAFLIPTPGQYEQEYLAKKLKADGMLPYAKQEDFRVTNLLEIDLFKGLPKVTEDIHWKQLFCLFESE